MKHLGRIEFEEEELCELLGYPGGQIKFVGWMDHLNKVGVVIEHPAMPEHQPGGEILRLRL